MEDVRLFFRSRHAFLRATAGGNGHAFEARKTHVMASFRRYRIDADTIKIVGHSLVELRHVLVNFGNLEKEVFIASGRQF